MIRLFNTSERRKARLKNTAILVCDLDGTLLDNENQVPPEVVTSIDLLRDAGVEIVLASGRSVSFTHFYAECVGSTLPVISVNGGLITQPGLEEAIYCSAIPKGLISDVLTFELESKLDFEISAFTASGVFSRLESPTIPTYLRSELNVRKITDDLLAIESRCGLLVIYGAYITIQQLSVQLAHKYRSIARRVMYTSKQTPEYSYLEIQHSRTNKGHALSVLCKQLGIPKKHTAAIGDFVNDVEMLKIAGFSSAMSNAIEEVKQYADFVTTKTNDEGGTAEFMQLILDARN